MSWTPVAVAKFQGPVELRLLFALTVSDEDDRKWGWGCWSLSQWPLRERQQCSLDIVREHAAGYSTRHRNVLREGLQLLHWGGGACLSCHMTSSVMEHSGRPRSFSTFPLSYCALSQFLLFVLISPDFGCRNFGLLSGNGGAVYSNLLDLAAAFVDSENTVRLSPSLGFSLFERALLFTWLSLQKSPLDRMLLLRQQTHEKRNLCKTSRYLSRVFRQNVSFSMISGSFKYGLTLTQ